MDDLGHFFTNLRPHYQNSFSSLFCFVFYSRMSKNMCKLGHKLRNAKKGVCPTLTWSNEAGCMDIEDLLHISGKCCVILDHNNVILIHYWALEHSRKPNPSQEGYYNRINPLVEGVPPHIHRPPPGGRHIFTGLEYSGAFIQCRPYFPVVQLIGLHYSVLRKPVTLVSS